MNSKAKDLRDAANALIADTDQSLTELRAALALAPNELLGPAHCVAHRMARSAASAGLDVHALVMTAALIGIQVEMTRRAEQFRDEAEGVQ